MKSNTSMPRHRAQVRTAAGIAAVLILAGCSILGGKPKDPTTVYAPDPRVQADPSWPTVQWQLALTTPTAARIYDSARIAVRPSPAELEVYKGANWAKRPGDMLEDAVLRALEDSGRMPAVARQGSGIAGDYKLVLDLRRFEADYAGQAVPAATIEVSAKLLHALDQQVVLSRTFLQAQHGDPGRRGRVRSRARGGKPRHQRLGADRGRSTRA
jgi:cholesterol transport system auxiliary component